VIYPEGVWYRFESKDDIDKIVRVHLVEGGRVAGLLMEND